MHKKVIEKRKLIAIIFSEEIQQRRVREEKPSTNPPNDTIKPQQYKETNTMSSYVNVHFLWLFSLMKCVEVFVEIR